MYRIFFKRVIDILVSLTALLFLAPVIAIISVLLLIANRGTPFFLQARPGFKGHRFCIIKFKTMNDRCDDNGKLLPDSMRITKVGGFLRKTSLDELPQLINVLLGQMSLIGPRPLIFEYLPLYSKEQARRHDVRPGVTGLAQVNGRNAISWTKKFEYDVYYVDHLSFMLDVNIVLGTIKNVIQRKDINFSQKEGERRFNGYN
ncbi:MAG: sugar transferase [Bacteroidales bacterium]